MLWGGNPTQILLRYNRYIFFRNSCVYSQCTGTNEWST